MELLRKVAGFGTHLEEKRNIYKKCYKQSSVVCDTVALPKKMKKTLKEIKFLKQSVQQIITHKISFQSE